MAQPSFDKATVEHQFDTLVKKSFGRRSKEPKGKDSETGGSRIEFLRAE